MSDCEQCICQTVIRMQMLFALTFLRRGLNNDVYVLLQLYVCEMHNTPRTSCALRIGGRYRK